MVQKITDGYGLTHDDTVPTLPTSTLQQNPYPPNPWVHGYGFWWVWVWVAILGPMGYPCSSLYSSHFWFHFNPGIARNTGALSTNIGRGPLKFCFILCS